jgi:zona occludens toxin
MTIELQTGLPGACKTQYTLWRVEKIRRETGRPVFYSGIPINPDKLPDWQEIQADQWHTAPPESIVVIDEAQRLFRPRPNGSAVPAYEAALETHRHGGVDLILITQDPRLVSIGVRSLVGRHLHAVRRWGMELSTIHEWPECRLNVQSRKDSSQHQFRFRRQVYGWYKSAEAHTVKRAIPFRVWALVGAVVVIGGATWWTVDFMSRKADGSKVPASVLPAGAASMPAGFGPVTMRGAEHPRMSQAEYFEAYRPRVPGLAYTASAYDEVTKPVRAPYPAACVASVARCQCYTQQGTALTVTAELCRGIVSGGFFVAWDAEGHRVERAPAQAAATPVAAAEPLPGAIGIVHPESTRVDPLPAGESASAPQRARRRAG